MRTLPRDWFERIVIPAIVVIYAVGMPTWSFGRVLDGPHRTSAVVAAGVAAAGSIGLQLWLLVPAAQGRRPRYAGWLIASFVVINLAVFPLIGVLWFAAGEQVAVLAAVYLRPRWSVPVVAALTAVPATMAIVGHEVILGHYFAQNTAFWALTVGLLIWLARAAAGLRASRQELAGAAVVAERVRIDDELAVTLGAELESLIAAGRRAASTAAADPATAERELRALTEASRTALAQTRWTAGRYRAITARTEISTAVALLTAADIPAEVDVPPAVLDQAMDGERAAEFRAELTGVLHDQAAGRCLISADGADGSGGGLRLTISRQRRDSR